jgi:hypothetical protein
MRKQPARRGLATVVSQISEIVGGRVVPPAMAFAFAHGAVPPARWPARGGRNQVAVTQLLLNHAAIICVAQR